MVDTLSLLQKNITNSQSISQLIQALELVLKYGKNLLLSEERRPYKWRRIVKNNATYQRRMSQVKGGPELLSLFGYAEETTGHVFKGQVDAAVTSQICAELYLFTYELREAKNKLDAHLQDSLPSHARPLQQNIPSDNTTYTPVNTPRDQQSHHLLDPDKATFYAIPERINLNVDRCIKDISMDSLPPPIPDPPSPPESMPKISPPSPPALNNEAHLQKDQGFGLPKTHSLGDNSLDSMSFKINDLDSRLNEPHPYAGYTNKCPASPELPDQGVHCNRHPPLKRLSPPRADEIALTHSSPTSKFTFNQESPTSNRTSPGRSPPSIPLPHPPDTPLSPPQSSPDSSDRRRSQPSCIRGDRRRPRPDLDSTSSNDLLNSPTTDRRWSSEDATTLSNPNRLSSRPLPETPKEYLVRMAQEKATTGRRSSLLKQTQVTDESCCVICSSTPTCRCVHCSALFCTEDFRRYHLARGRADHAAIALHDKNNSSDTYSYITPQELAVKEQLACDSTTCSSLPDLEVSGTPQPDNAYEFPLLLESKPAARRHLSEQNYRAHTLGDTRDGYIIMRRPGGKDADKVAPRRAVTLRQSSENTNSQDDTVYIKVVKDPDMEIV